jgi:dimethylaniline monooxygenase (N-oxide forming)
MTALGQAAVCVIGAGVAGIGAMKGLREAGIDFECFDERDRVGGIWAYQDEPGRTCVWAMLNMNSPRGTYEFSDFAMPQDFPDFPRREQCWTYLERAVDRFGLRSAIRLKKRVERIEKRDGIWHVSLDDGASRAYRAVVVANGHHNTPRMPQIPGAFAGSTIHSRDYRRRESYSGRRVLVVGYGNSGAQIAVDVSHVAAETLLAMRSGTWILPHYVHGIRIDRIFDGSRVGYLPPRVDSWLSTLLYRLTIGRPDRHGLPKPTRSLAEIFPTISESLVNRIGDGRIRITPAPASFGGNDVTFSDGTSAQIDDVIYATGYEITFPFLDASVFSAPENRVRLYLRTFLPDDPSLSFIGAYQANGQWGFLPLMEMQGKLVAAHLAGRYALPSRGEMQAAIEQEEREIARRFVDTPRHHYQMIGAVFMRQLAAELKRGARRARRGAKVSGLYAGGLQGSR